MLDQGSVWDNKYVLVHVPPLFYSPTLCHVSFSFNSFMPYKQFAYNEMSFMIIRFMQHFSSITLDMDACPPEARPPAAWKDGVGRKTIEKVWPKMHLTMYPEVCSFSFFRISSCWIYS